MQSSTLLKVAFVLFMMGIWTPVPAQNDVPGSKDSKLITRFPDSWIVRYDEKEYESYTAALENTFPKGKSKIVEGKVTSIDYELSKGKSQLELHKNYEGALRKKGYKILFSCYQEGCNPRGGSFTSIVYELYYAKKLKGLAKQGNTYRNNQSTYLIGEKEQGNQKTTIVVMSGFASYGNTYRIDVIESKAMRQDLISVTDIDDSLKERGSMAFYDILFDFNKTTLLPESSSPITIIAEYLKKHPTTSVYVVGHTDNVGSLDANLELSEGRAKAVMNELVNKHGIPKNRLEAKGVAMLSPVATNDSEEGRKLNRRVEIVKR